MSGGSAAEEQRRSTGGSSVDLAELQLSEFMASPPE